MSRRTGLLLVEDNPGDTVLIREMLPRSGPGAFELESAARLSDALSRLDKGGIEAVILDLGLPDSRGLATVEAVAGRHPFVPIIVLTERADDEDAVAAVKAGAQDYLVKAEITPTVLLRSLRYALERKQAEKALRSAARKWRDTFDAISDAVFLMDAGGRILQCNRAFADLCQRSFGEIIGQPCAKVLHGDKGPSAFCPRLKARASLARESMILVREGREYELILDPVVGESGAYEGAVHIMRDVTDARTASRRQQLGAEVLQILNRSDGLPDLTRDIVHAIRESLDIEAAAIRIRDGEDYPYVVAEGFPDSFLRSGFPLARRAPDGQVVRTETGEPELICFCGAVITGSDDPRMKGFTAGGSFWANRLEDLQVAAKIWGHGLVPDAPCVAERFESQAFIPIRSGNEVLGLLQLSDRRTGRFNSEQIAFLEGLAASIGVAVRRVRDTESVAVSESRFRGLFENIHSGVAVYDAVDGAADFVVRDFNAAAERIDGVTKAQIVGKKLTEAFPGVGPFGLLEVMRRVWRSGRTELFPAAFYKDERISGWRVNSVYKLPNGEIVSVFDDITERKRTEAELQFQNLILSTQQEASADGILVVNDKGQLLSWNRRFVEMFGIPASLLGSVTDDPLLEYVTKLMADPEAFLGRVRYLYGQIKETSWDELALADGRVFERFSAPMVGADSHYFGRVWFFRDISERVRSQAEREKLQAQLLQSQKLEAIGTLAGGVAHEINNPIMGVLNYAELLRDRVKEDPEGRDYVQEIIAESGRIAGIVRDLLRFSRHEKAEARSPARIGDIVDVTLSLIRTVLRHDQIRLETDVPADLPLVVCRSQQIQQVFLNLITNARDALNERYQGADEGKRIRVSALTIQDDRAWTVRVTVEDSGPGIPPEIRDRLFEPFFTTKPKERGTGLGLPISHGIVCDHGGRLWFESEIGRGTRFYVDLPAQRPKDPETAEMPAVSPSPAREVPVPASAKQAPAAPRRSRKRSKRGGP